MIIKIMERIQIININTWHTATPEPGSMASMLVISSVETTTSSNTGTLPPTRPVLPPWREGGCRDKCDEFSDQHLGTDGELPGGAVGEDAGHLPRVPGPEHAAAGPPHCAQPVLIVLGGALARGQHPTWVTLEGHNIQEEDIMSAYSPGSRMLWNVLTSSLVKDAKSPLFRFGYLSDVSCTGPRLSRALKVENVLFRELSLSKAR